MSQSKNHLSRRGFLKLTGSAAAVTLLAACAPVAQAPGGGAAEPAAAKSLTVWAHRSFAPPADDVLLANIEKWAEENGVDLELVAEIEVPIMNERLTAAIESKTLPDVSAIAGGRVALHYPAGIYLDVSELYKELADAYGGYYRPAEQTATIDGAQWVIPYSTDTSLMYYRQDILDEKGLSLPTTWQEYLATVSAAQNPPDIYGTGIALNKAATDAQNSYNLMLLSFGGSMVAEDGKTVVVNSQQTRDWLTFVTSDLYGAGVFPPSAFEWDNASNNAAYQEESALTIHNPASVLVWLYDNKPELAEVTTIKALPAGPAGAFNSGGVRVAWALFNSSAAEQQDLGKDLLRYLQEPEQFEPWIALAFAAPAVAAFEDMEIWSDPKRAGFLEGSKTGVMSGYPGPVTPAAAELDSLVPATSMVLRVLVDGWTVDEAVEEAEQVANDVYSKY